MRFLRLVPVLAAVMALATAARAQDSAQVAARQAQVRAMLEQIARERPPQAEAAARELLRRLQVEQPMLNSLLDSLRNRSNDQYWQEVAQLTVQLQMLRGVQDSMRENLMAAMFGAEARARSLQRAYRETVDSVQERAIRQRLRIVLDRHFAAEDSLRSLEIAEVERRLAQVRAETVRRRRERAELVRRMVDDVLRDARRP